MKSSATLLGYRVYQGKLNRHCKRDVQVGREGEKLVSLGPEIILCLLLGSRVVLVLSVLW